MRKFSRTSGVNCKTKKIIGVKRPDGYYDMRRIRTKKEKPIWQLFVEYFDTLEIGQQFTRTDIISCSYVDEVVPAMRSQLTTVDNYKGYLKVLGFIKQVKPGVYEKVLNFPIGIPLTTVRNAMKDRNTWKGWFEPLHVKLGVEESDLK